MNILKEFQVLILVITGEKDVLVDPEDIGRLRMLDQERILKEIKL